MGKKKDLSLEIDYCNKHLNLKYYKHLKIKSTDRLL